MRRDRGRVFESLGFKKWRLEPKDAARRFIGPPGYPDMLPVYFVSTRRRCHVCAFSSGLHSQRSPLTLTNPQPPLHSQQPSPIHPSLLYGRLHTTTPPLASTVHSLTPQSRLSTHFTLASSRASLRCLDSCAASSPPLCARHRPPSGEILELQAH